MVRRRPLAGVGLGAYAAEFGPAKLALQDEGVEFPAETYHAAFDHAHNDVLEVAAELGVPGFLALLWGGAVVARQAWRRGRDPAGRDERAWTAAGLALLAVLALAGFPFRVALVAYPALVFLAWVLRPEPPA
jgi:O-antigen ligase